MDDVQVKFYPGAWFHLLLLPSFLYLEVWCLGYGWLKCLPVQFHLLFLNNLAQLNKQSYLREWFQVGMSVCSYQDSSWCSCINQSDLLINLPALLLILNISSCFEKMYFFLNIVQEMWAVSSKHFFFHLYLIFMW